MAFLRKWQVPHPMETIEVEHSREIWSKTTAWAGANATWARHEKSERSHGECGMGTIRVIHVFHAPLISRYHRRLKDIIGLLLEQNKTITTCNIRIKDNHYEFAAMRKPCTAIPEYASKVMRSATSAWKQDIKKPFGSFCDLTQRNTLVTYEKHVIKLLKSFNTL